MLAFRLAERSVQPGCSEIRVEGELDLAVADQLQEAIDRMPEHDRLLINLEGCDFIDSTGIAVILRAQGKRSRNGGIALYGCSDQVLRVLSITGLTGNGLVFRTDQEALAGQASAE